ncbi:hypothetical protein LK337_2302 [Lactococcus lactis subsp. lactis]|jgi:hypothetical protein|nr:hypothetical protein LK337_2302 [Lactococcus lactis subsp. lactis]
MDSIFKLAGFPVNEIVYKILFIIILWAIIGAILGDIFQ